MFLKDLRVFNTADAAAGAPEVTAPPSVVDGGAPQPSPAAAPTPEPAAAAPAPVVDLPADVNPNAPKWALRRISDEAEARRRERERADSASRERDEALALVESLRRQQPGAPAATPPPSDRQPQVSEAEIMRRVAAVKLNEDSNQVLSQGMQAYGAGFQSTLAVLQAAGVTNNDGFVADLIAVDRANAHVILDRLAKEPERAAAIAALPDRQRIAELTRMSMTPKDAKPAAPGVSRAPAPAPHVAPSSSNVKDWRSDDATEEEFARGHAENMKTRSRRR